MSAGGRGAFAGRALSRRESEAAKTMRDGVASCVARSYGLREVVSSAVAVARCHPRRCGGRRGGGSGAAANVGRIVIVVVSGWCRV